MKEFQFPSIQDPAFATPSISTHMTTHTDMSLNLWTHNVRPLRVRADTAHEYQKKLALRTKALLQ